MAAQADAQGVYPLPRARADGKHVRARAAVLVGDVLCHLRVDVALVDGDDGFDALFPRREQQAVGHEQVRLRRGGGDDDQHSVDVGDRRAGELAFAREDGLEPAVFLLCARLELHPIAHHQALSARGVNLACASQ